MSTLNRMLILSFLQTLIISIVFFVFLIELVDLFANLWRYLNNDASIISILKVAYLYLPKCIFYAISPALLFSVSYTLGTFYSNNELIAIFGSGISLFKFTLPLIIAGLIFSLGSFLFNEVYVIETFKEKNELSNVLLGYNPSFSNTNITIVSDKNIIYHADYYNDNSKTLSGLILIIRDTNGSFIERIDAEWGEYKNNIWELNRVRIFKLNSKNMIIEEKYENKLLRDSFNEPPDTFKRLVKDINELNISDAKDWILSIRKAGLPIYKEALVDYYERFSFALTPFIVIFISSSLGGRFKKNILLMSLLSSLSISVLYYVLKMILILLAKQGYLQPITGAWGAFIISTISGIILYKKART
ncbi:MAG: LptF/LptG family permease [Spirochaetales bacterium]|nr:LptF/LptG family permease [Spirochaetales bacterium]